MAEADRMTEQLLTPSKITAWLDCAHYLTLRERVDAGLLDVEPSYLGAFAQLLVEKGIQHELECLEKFRSEGRTIYEVPARRPGESFADWVERLGTPWDDGFDVIYQMPFIHDGMRGIADFLIKVDEPQPGECPYEPVDAKLARVEAKPGHVLQLCFYADALEAATGASPKRLHLWLGSGHMESLATRSFHPYWRRLRTQLRVVLQDGAPPQATRPEPCVHCDFCEFTVVCDNQWRDEDSLVFVAGVRPIERFQLEVSGIATLANLASRSGGVDSMRPERLERLVGQAALQVEARNEPGPTPPFQLIPFGEDPTWGHGLELLPVPDDGDVFLDFEGDPFWQRESGLFFLFGFITRDPDGRWIYQGHWAHDRAGEEQATGQLIAFLSERRSAHPDMHVYHYNHTERSALQRLAAEHGVGEQALTEMVDTGMFIDLYTVVRNAVQVGTESYGLKYTERLAGYERNHEIEGGSGAVVEYEQYMVTADGSILDRIAAYNEDDVRATLALRGWLVAQRPEGLPWRSSRLDPEEEHPDLDERVAALHCYGPNTPEHLLGDLLGYWVREFRAYKAPKLARITLETEELLDDPDVIAGLEFRGIEPRYGKKGQELKTQGARFRWPDQAVSENFRQGGASVLYGTPDGRTGYATVAEIDEKKGEVLLIWGDRAVELGVYPVAVAYHDWVSPNPKPAALDEIAASVLEASGSTTPNPASISLLRRDGPAFTSGDGPPGGEFLDDLEAMCEWAKQLDGDFVSIQGPPGTGKTYWGAHIVHSLICAGRRVGITAMSHHAIDNLLEEILRVFEKKGDLSKLAAVRRVPAPPRIPLPGVNYATTNPPCVKDEYNLVAGTTWLFSGGDMRGAPVDVLVVDEAGQLALADTLAASTSAKNIVLLGDPLQLPQVAQAVHPGFGGSSGLEHVLGDDVTLPADRGVFLTQTRRMHPDVCTFISEEIYEGRLKSHPDCARQDTQFGTGLRWLQADHAGRSTESIEEAQLVATEIRRLLGTPWVNQHGDTNPLTAADFMVVAPYNDQVALLREVLDADVLTQGITVGTVDKFQGREAAVVFFTMTTSSSDYMPRSAEFLFSRNRLNVAISRARCLAYLVCTEDLLNSRARSVEEMRLISTLCSFVEYCPPGS
jgi:predicted RecB family nuclease